MQFYTADVCDAYRDRVQVLTPRYHAYGGIEHLHGPITTLRLTRNNAALIDLLNEPGNRRIAVVDVDAECYAVVGENLMKLAYANDWAGILVHGYVRDTHITHTIPVGLWALGTCPRKSFEDHPARRDELLTIDGVTITPKHHFMADQDGIIIVDDGIMRDLTTPTTGTAT
jgi:regulator of ribonuclease activity A